MDFLTTYQDAFVVFLNSQDRIVGCGIAIDSSRIITCAHVVNAALGVKLDSLDDQSGQKVRVCFKLNTSLQGEAKFDRASVSGWFPKGNRFELIDDLAVLDISKQEIKDKLAAIEKDIEFVGAETREHFFKLLSYDVAPAEQISMEVNGIVGSFIQEEGKTVLLVDNPNNPFIQGGCSGAPVFSTALHGIIGLTQSLKKFNAQPNARSGFIIDSRAFHHRVDGISIKPRGVQYYGSEKKMLRVNYQKLHHKYMCDRREMLGYIDNQLKEPDKKSGISFILTDFTKHEGPDDILIRYKAEFIDPEHHQNLSFHTYRIPDTFNLTVFKSSVYEDFEENIANNLMHRQLSSVNNLYDLFQLDTDTLKKPMLCLIDCDLEKINNDYSVCFKWFFTDFLNVNQLSGIVSTCHFVFIGRYNTRKGEKAFNVVREGFGSTTAHTLKNINVNDVHRWIDHYVNDNMRSTLRQKFVASEYEMREIYSAYHQVYNQVNNF